MQKSSRKSIEPLTILHVASGDLWAGAEVQMYHLLRAMRLDPRLRLNVALMNDGELAARLRRMDVNVTIFDEGSLTSPSILLGLLHLIRRLKADVVHTHRTKENVLASFAALLAGRAVSLRTVHGNPEYATLRSRLMYSLDRFVARNLQKCVVAVSGDLAGQLAKRFPGASLECIPNGIDAEFVAEESRRSQITLRPAAFHLCFVGRLVPVKRVDLVIRVAADLERRRPSEFRIHIIGDGPQSDSLQQMTQELQVGHVVEFHGFQSNCMPVLRQMHALLLTSDHEGLPMIALEALALGVPVIAHAVGGLPELLRQAQAGYVLPSQEPQAFANAVEALIAHTTTQRTNLLLTAYSAANSAARYAALYQRLSATARGDHIAANAESGS